MPPLFAVPTIDSTEPLSPSVFHRVSLTSGMKEDGKGPSFLEYLHQSDPSVRLVNDYMNPGFWLHASPLQGSSSQVRGAFPPPPISPVNISSSNPSGGLFFDYNLGLTGNHVIHLAVRTESAPSIRYHGSLGRHLSLVTEANSGGKSWIGANVFHKLSYAPSKELSLQCGSWIGKTGNSSEDSLPAFPRAGSVYAAMEGLGATVAFETSLADFSTRSYASLNLAEEEEDSGSQKQPPLLIAAERWDEKVALSLTQMFSFDRYHFNPLEERAPFVRNSVAWTIRMERILQLQPDSAIPGTDLSAALAWQVNRTIAVKTVVHPQDRTMTSSIMFKRWREPRVLCSLLHRYNWSTGKHAFLGIGLEYETGEYNGGDSRTSIGHYEYPASPTGLNLSSPKAPETRVVLTDKVRSEF